VPRTGTFLFEARTDLSKRMGRTTMRARIFQWAGVSVVGAALALTLTGCNSSDDAVNPPAGGGASNVVVSASNPASGDGTITALGSLIVNNGGSGKDELNLSETGHDTNISFLTGKAQSNKANLTQSKTYYQQSDYRFDMKTFTELRNAQSVTIAYDGLNPMPPLFCYLKPYFNDPNKSYFRQAADGEL
jgi:hypothetical protein